MNTPINLNPWSILDEMLDGNSRLFSNLRARALGKFPPVNVFLDDNAVIVDLKLPGKTAKDIELSLEPQAVVIADRPATKVNAEGDASFQFAVPVLSASASRTLVVSQGGSKHADGNFSKASISANLSVNTICTMGDMITAESPAGAIGVIDGRKAVVVNLWGTKYAVALSNEGDYCDFDEAAEFFHGTDLNVWRVPTMDEMKALTDLPREYDSTASAIEFKTAGGSVSFPLAGLSSSAEGIAEVGGHGYYYTSTPLEGAEGDIVCFMDKKDGQPYVIYLANAMPDKFKMSLRLFYQLTAFKHEYLIAALN